MNNSREARHSATDINWNTLLVSIQLDVVCFSHIAQLAAVDKEVVHPLRDWLLENGQNLVQHFEKMKEKYVWSYQILPATNW